MTIVIAMPYGVKHELIVILPNSTATNRLMTTKVIHEITLFIIQHIS